MFAQRLDAVFKWVGRRTCETCFLSFFFIFILVMMENLLTTTAAYGNNEDVCYLGGDFDLLTRIEYSCFGLRWEKGTME